MYRTIIVTALLISIITSKASASDAEKQRAAIQKQLAAGTEYQKRLRIDTFEIADGAVKAAGIFLDVPQANSDGPIPLEQASKELTTLIRDTLNNQELKIDTSGIIRIPSDQIPHVVLQLAVNKKATEGESQAEQLLFTDTVFTASGELRITGYRADNDSITKWLESARLSSLLRKNPALRNGDDSEKITLELKPVEWKTSTSALQKQLAASGNPKGSSEEKSRAALRRLLVQQAYFTYEIVKEEGKSASATLRFHIEGIRIGDEAVKPEWVQEVTGPAITATAGKPVPGNYGSLVRVALDEPIQHLRAAVAGNPALDGVRIDPGITIGANGELLLAGIQPGLSAKDVKALEKLVQATFVEYGKGKLLAERYNALAKRPVAATRMTELPLQTVMKVLRMWVADTKDDLKLQRLYFPDQLSSIQKQFHVEANGLVLLFRPVSAADAKAVEVEFRRLLSAHVKGDIPESILLVPKPDPATSTTEKEPFLPSMSAQLRKELAADQKKWSGVLIERGYFDAANRYTLCGVVESREQVRSLEKLLASKQEDSEWAEYFVQPLVALEFAVIPMKDMLDRIRRVTPAYPTLDGIRIESAQYDASGNLSFDAHIVGRPAREAAAQLEKLLRDHPIYKRRVPEGKSVRINRQSGAENIDDLTAGFSLEYGAKLLVKAGDSKQDREKAREWVDSAILHHANEAGVWYLSAYYNFAYEKDDELVRRDLYRMIAQEGPLTAATSAQRKRRYEAAKDLQGKVRNELDALWIDCLREIKDGAKPIALQKKEN